MLTPLFIPKSHIDLIIEEMFASIENMEEFDEHIIQELKELAQFGGLKRNNEVAKILKPASGELI